MESSAEEKKTREEVSSAIGTMEAEQTEETDQHTGKTHTGNPTLRTIILMLQDMELCTSYN